MRLFIPPERRSSAIEILRIVQERVGICPDYFGCCIKEGDSPCPHILYLERWKSKEALYDHIRSPLYRCVLAAIEMSNRPPEISFYFVWPTDGMELIQSLRQGAPQELINSQAA